MKLNAKIQIYIIFAIGIQALAEEANLKEFFSASRQDDDIDKTITSDMKKGVYYECYPKTDYKMYQKCTENVSSVRQKIQPVISQLEHRYTEMICCIPQKYAYNEEESHGINQLERSNGQCGIWKSYGYQRKGTKPQTKDNARITLMGEYPWRALIWRKGTEDGPFCAGTVIDSATTVILTSASCAFKYGDVKTLMVTFNRTRTDAVPVNHTLIHEEYDKRKPFVNNIALLVLDTQSITAPSWVKPACFSNRPPMYATLCTVMSPEDYFIDTAVPQRKKCEVDKKNLDISQMCSVTLEDEYKAELGAGLFCRDWERSQNLNYFVSGITLQVRGQLITYTNVSNFEEWIKRKLSTVISTNSDDYYE